MAKLNKSTSTKAKMKATGAKYSTTSHSGKQRFYASSDAEKPIATSTRESKTVTPVITPEKLQKTDVPNIPGFPAPDDTGPVNLANDPALAGLGFTVKDNQAVILPEEQAIQQTGNAQMSNLKSIMDFIGKPQSQAEAYKDLYGINERQTRRQFDKAQQDVNAYTANLNDIVSRSQAQQLALEGQGRGQTEAFVGGEQARINREATIAALPVQAQLAAAQGNLELAQTRLDRLFTLKQQDINADYDYKTRVGTAMLQVANDTQSRILQAKLNGIQEKKTQATNNLNYLRQLQMQALEYGQTGLVSSIGAIDPKSKTFEQDAARALSQLRKPVSGVKAPDLQNFGTPDNPDWRQFNPTTGGWEEIEGVGTPTGTNLSKVQKAKISDSVAANKELSSLIGEYSNLLSDVGFEGSTFGGKNLGTFRALKARMTTVLKKAETLGTLDKGVTDLIDQLVGEIPEKSGLTQNLFGFKSRSILSQLATQQRLIQDKIRTDEERLGGGIGFSLTSSDLSELDELFGDTANSTESFDPANFY